MNLRQLFLQHVGQTSEAPLAIEIAKAYDCTLEDISGKKYLDLIGGISVANIGHSNPRIIEAGTNQLKHHLHTMVYGELVQSAQVLYAEALAASLPQTLDSVFFTSSGAEATEGAIKLAKRVTGRSKLIACNKSYHGSTQGALSLIGDEYWRNAYRPLLPDVWHYDYNSIDFINAIDKDTAAVFVELVQAESGVTPAKQEWIDAIRNRCTQVGALMVVDEAQTGFGRTGKLWGINTYNIVPDVMLLAKAIGGGTPLGAFVASRELMSTLSYNPVLGNISTFGGHPLSCAIGLEAFNILCNSNIINEVESKGAYLENAIKALGIKCYQRCGLWMGIFFKDYETNKRIIDACIARGVFTDWFLFASNALRVSPPLIISYDEIDFFVEVLKEVISLELG